MCPQDDFIVLQVVKIYFADEEGRSFAQEGAQ